MFKKTLAWLLTMAMLVGMLSGLTIITASAEEVWFWNLVEDWSFSVADGKTFANAETFSVKIPEGLTNSDLQLHLNVTLNAAAAAQMNSSSTVELDNDEGCDKSEIQWSTAGAGKWKEGVNDVYLLFSQGNDGRGTDWKEKNGAAFTIERPIVYCRIFSNAQSSGEGSVKVNYIRVETTQAYRDGGINFADDDSDTYLRLTDPLSGTPNTIEAAVKLEALDPVTEWQVYNGASNGTGIGWGGNNHTATFEKWVTEGDGEQPAAGTPYVEYACKDEAVPEWGGGLTAPISVKLPKEYLMQDLALSFWFYIGDITAFNNTGIWLRLSTNTTWDTDYLPGPSSKNWNLKQGWNHVVLQLSDFGAPSSANFDLYNLNFFEFRNVNFTKPSVFRLADVKIIATGGPSAASFYTVFSDEGEGNTTPVALKINTKNGNPTLLWGGKKLVADCNVCTGERVHIAAVRDTAAQKLILYVNGENVAESTDYPTANIVPTKPHAIGATTEGAGRFAGVIADLCVWSVSRTAGEIAANTEPGRITGAEEGLLGAWTLRGNITHVLDTLPDSTGKNPVIYAGTRADQWIDYEVPEEIGDDYYTMVWIPDPQNVTISKGLQQWNDDMDWIAANVEKENIFHVASAGDNTWTDSVGTWNIVKNSFAKFWDKVSWSSCTGNHDYPGSTNDNVHYRDTTNYNNALGLTQIQSTAAKDTFAGWYQDDGTTPETDYVEHPSGTENSYYTFTINGVNWMLLQLEYQPRPSVLAWANEVLKDYPDYNVILATHGYIGGSKNPNAADYQGCWMNYTKEEKAAGDFTENTQAIYTNVVEPNSNIKMVICGHAANPSYDEAVLTRNEVREDGSVVYQLMLNAQYLDTDDSTNFAYYNDRCVGMLGLFRFSADGTKVAVNWYCPSDNKTYEPCPDGNDPATTMGPNPHSLSNFLLPIDLVVNALPLREAIENAYEDLSVFDQGAAAAYTAAVQAGAQLLETDYTQAQVDAALAAIEVADALLISDVDKTALEAAVNAAVEDLSGYTKESAAAYTAALEAAKAVLADKSATPAAIASAAAALETAEAGLTLAIGEIKFTSGAPVSSGALHFSTTECSGNKNPEMGYKEAPGGSQAFYVHKEGTTNFQFTVDTDDVKDADGNITFLVHYYVEGGDANWSWLSVGSTGQIGAATNWSYRASGQGDITNPLGALTTGKWAIGEFTMPASVAAGKMYVAFGACGNGTIYVDKMVVAPAAAVAADHAAADAAHDDGTAYIDFNYAPYPTYLPEARMLKTNKIASYSPSSELDKEKGYFYDADGNKIGDECTFCTRMIEDYKISDQGVRYLSRCMNPALGDTIGNAMMTAGAHKYKSNKSLNNAEYVMPEDNEPVAENIMATIKTTDFVSYCYVNIDNTYVTNANTHNWTIRLDVPKGHGQPELQGDTLKDNGENQGFSDCGCKVTKVPGEKYDTYYFVCSKANFCNGSNGYDFRFYITQPTHGVVGITAYPSADMTALQNAYDEANTHRYKTVEPLKSARTAAEALLNRGGLTEADVSSAVVALEEAVATMDSGSFSAFVDFSTGTAVSRNLSYTVEGYLQYSDEIDGCRGIQWATGQGTSYTKLNIDDAAVLDVNGNKNPYWKVTVKYYDNSDAAINIQYQKAKITADMTTGAQLDATTAGYNLARYATGRWVTDSFVISNAYFDNSSRMNGCDARVTFTNNGTVIARIEFEPISAEDAPRLAAKADLGRTVKKAQLGASAGAHFNTLATARALLVDETATAQQLTDANTALNAELYNKIFFVCTGEGTAFKYNHSFGNEVGQPAAAPPAAVSDSHGVEKYAYLRNGHYLYISSVTGGLFGKRTTVNCTLTYKSTGFGTQPGKYPGDTSTGDPRWVGGPSFPNTNGEWQTVTLTFKDVCFKNKQNASGSVRFNCSSNTVIASMVIEEAPIDLADTTLLNSDDATLLNLAAEGLLNVSESVKADAVDAIAAGDWTPILNTIAAVKAEAPHDQAVIAFLDGDDTPAMYNVSKYLIGETSKPQTTTEYGEFHGKNGVNIGERVNSDTECFLYLDVTDSIVASDGYARIDVICLDNASIDVHYNIAVPEGVNTDSDVNMWNFHNARNTYTYDAGNGTYDPNGAEANIYGFIKPTGDGTQWVTRSIWMNNVHFRTAANTYDLRLKCSKETTIAAVIVTEITEEEFDKHNATASEGIAITSAQAAASEEFSIALTAADTRAAVAALLGNGCQASDLTAYAVGEYKGEAINLPATEQNGNLVFDLLDISPDMFGAQFSLTPVLKKGDKEVSRGKPIEYSMRDYFEKVMEQNETMGATMLLYAAAVDNYRNQKDTSVIADNVSAAFKTQFADVQRPTDANPSISGEAGSVKWASAKVIISNVISMQFTVTGATDGMVMKIGNKSVEIKNNVARITLNATQLNDNFVVGVYDSDTLVSKRLTYSLKAYANQAWDGSDSRWKALLQGLLSYAQLASTMANPA